jgi:hypothetical protein
MSSPFRRVGGARFFGPVGGLLARARLFACVLDSASSGGGRDRTCYRRRRRLGLVDFRSAQQLAGWPRLSVFRAVGSTLRSCNTRDVYMVPAERNGTERTDGTNQPTNQAACEKCRLLEPVEKMKTPIERGGSNCTFVWIPDDP